MIAICSLFRDNADDVKRVFANRERWQYPQDQLLHVCVEGDSQDDTYDALCKMKAKHRVIVAQYHCGRPRFPSVIEPERLSVLAKTSNVALDIAMAEKPSHIMWLDSDVTTQDQLLPILLEAERDLVAPMFYFERSIFFRDTWGYRNPDGSEYTNRPPFAANYDRKKPFEASSVGLPLFRASVAEAGARFTEEEEMVGFCRSARALGFKIFCHPHVYAEHPRMGIEIPRMYERNY